MRRLVFMLAAVANLALLDQAVKECVHAKMAVGEAFDVIPSLFRICYVRNRGCAWGMLQGQVWPLAAFAVAAMAFVVWKRRSIFPPGFAGAAAEAMLYAGIAGNLIDRIFRGYVVDMFDFFWRTHHFPCFNVADSLITVSAGIIIACSFAGKHTS